MKKGSLLPLEYVVSILILSVLVLVVTYLIKGFSLDISVKIKNLFSSEEEIEFPQIVEGGMFSSGQVASYITSCYETIHKLPLEKREDTICYILFGNFSGVNNADIMNSLSEKLKNSVVLRATYTEDQLIIQYDYLNDTIIVRD